MACKPPDLDSLLPRLKCNCRCLLGTITIMWAAFADGTADTGPYERQRQIPYRGTQTTQTPDRCFSASKHGTLHLTQSVERKQFTSLVPTSKDLTASGTLAERNWAEASNAEQLGSLRNCPFKYNNREASPRCPSAVSHDFLRGHRCRFHGATTRRCC